jgi:FG-GAP-like repeat
VTVHFGEAGNFGPGVDWVAELSGGDVTASDLDRDGIPDLVVTARTQSGIPDVPLEVLHGGPAGTQGERVAMRVNDQLAGVAAVDFDGNGYVDLVMALADEPELRIALDRAVDWMTLGHAVPAADGVPDLEGTGAPVAGQPVSMTATTASPGQAGLLFVGLDASFAPLAGGFLVPSVDAVIPVLSGGALVGRWPAGLEIGTAVYFQAWFVSAAGSPTATNALVTIAQ